MDRNCADAQHPLWHTHVPSQGGCPLSPRPAAVPQQRRAWATCGHPHPYPPPPRPPSAAFGPFSADAPAVGRSPNGAPPAAAAGGIPAGARPFAAASGKARESFRHDGVGHCQRLVGLARSRGQKITLVATPPRSNWAADHLLKECQDSLPSFQAISGSLLYRAATLL